MDLLLIFLLVLLLAFLVSVGISYSQPVVIVPQSRETRLLDSAKKMADAVANMTDSAIHGRGEMYDINQELESKSDQSNQVPIYPIQQ